MNDLKEKGITISLSTIATLIPVLAFIWFIIQPVLLTNISDAMADDIDKKMNEHSRPIESAFKVIIKQEIAKARRSIALLEYRRDHDPDSWNEEHARLLADRYLELQALQEAYSEL